MKIYITYHNYYNDKGISNFKELIFTNSIKKSDYPTFFNPKLSFSYNLNDTGLKNKYITLDEWNLMLSECRLIKGNAESYSPELPDVGFFGLGNMFVSKKAREVLELKVDSTIDFYPITSDLGEYYFCYTKKLVNGINLTTSKVKYFDRRIANNDMTVEKVEVYDFIQVEVQDKIIFRPRITGIEIHNYFLTETFFDLVSMYGLKSNIEALLIWDSEDEDFIDERWLFNLDYWRELRQLQKSAS